MLPYTDKLNPWSSHSQIARMLEGLPIGSRILDVGVGLGTLARLCEGKGFVFQGIEPNSICLDNARNFYSDIYEGTLEQAPESFLKGYSAIVCGDVLEHLVNPLEQLHRLVNAQSVHSIFIISVPNIANLWIRLNLLFGRFNYTDRGILDRTHLHFFTKKTLLTLLKYVGLEIEELQATPIPLDLISPFFEHNILGKKLYEILAWLTKKWPTMLGYQWTVKAKKRKT